MFTRARFEENQERASDSSKRSGIGGKLVHNAEFLHHNYVYCRPTYSRLQASEQNMWAMLPTQTEVEQGELLEMRAAVQNLLCIHKPPDHYARDEWVKRMEKTVQDHRQSMGSTIAEIYSYLIRLGKEGPWKNIIRDGNDFLYWYDISDVRRIFDNPVERFLAKFRLLALLEDLCFSKTRQPTRERNISNFIVASMGHVKMRANNGWTKMAYAAIAPKFLLKKNMEKSRNIFDQVDLSVLYEMIQENAFPDKKYGSNLIPVVLERFNEDDFELKDVEINKKRLSDLFRVVENKVGCDRFLELFDCSLNWLDCNTKPEEVKGLDAYTSYSVAFCIHKLKKNSEAALRVMTRMLIRCVQLVDILQLDIEFKIEALKLLVDIFPKSTIGRACSLALFILRPDEVMYARLIEQYYHKYEKAKDLGVCLFGRARDFIYQYPKRCLASVTSDQFVWAALENASDHVDYTRMNEFCSEFLRNRGFSMEHINRFYDAREQVIHKMQLLPKPVKAKKPSNPRIDAYFNTLPYYKHGDIVQVLQRHMDDTCGRRLNELADQLEIEIDCSCVKCTGINSPPHDDPSQSHDDEGEEEENASDYLPDADDSDVLQCTQRGCPFTTTELDELNKHLIENHKYTRTDSVLLPRNSFPIYRSRRRPNLIREMRNHYTEEELETMSSDSIRSDYAESIAQVAKLLANIRKSSNTQIPVPRDQSVPLESNAIEVVSSESECDGYSMEGNSSRLDKSDMDSSTIAMESRQPEPFQPGVVDASNIMDVVNADGTGEETPTLFSALSTFRRDQRRSARSGGKSGEDSGYLSQYEYSSGDEKYPVMVSKHGKSESEKVFNEVDEENDLLYCGLCFTSFQSGVQYSKHTVNHLNNDEALDYEYCNKKPNCTHYYKKRIATFECFQCRHRPEFFTKEELWDHDHEYHPKLQKMLERSDPNGSRSNIFDIMTNYADSIGKCDANKLEVPHGDAGQWTFSSAEKQKWSKQAAEQCKLFYDNGIVPQDVFLTRNQETLEWDILVTGYYRFAPFAVSLVEENLETDEMIEKKCPALYHNLVLTYMLKYSEETSDYKIKSNTSSCDFTLPTMSVLSLRQFFACHIAIPRTYTKVPGKRYKCLELGHSYLAKLSAADFLRLLPARIDFAKARDTTAPADFWIDFKSNHLMFSKSFPRYTGRSVVDIPSPTPVCSPGAANISLGNEPPNELSRRQGSVETTNSDQAAAFQENLFDSQSWEHLSYETPYSKNLYRKILKAREDYLAQLKDAPKPPPPPTAGRRGRPRKIKRNTGSLVPTPNGAKEDKSKTTPKFSTRKSTTSLVPTRRSTRARTGSVSDKAAVKNSPGNNGTKRGANRLMDEEPPSKRSTPSDSKSSLGAASHSLQSTTTLNLSNALIEKHQPMVQLSAADVKAAEEKLESNYLG